MTLAQLSAESDFYGLALLVTVSALAFSFRRTPLSRAFGSVLIGTLTILTDGLLGKAILLLAIIAALAEVGSWLQIHLQSRLVAVSTQDASLVLTLLLALPLLLAQGSSLRQRYQARPLAHAALLAQTGDWLAVEGEEQMSVLAPAALAGKIPQRLWLFPELSTPADWGTFINALDAAPPQYIVSSNTLMWDRLVRTGWFKDRYRQAQQFTSPAAPQSPVTVWTYVDSAFDRGETVPIQVRTDNGLQLTGYRYWPRAIQPNDAIYVTLDWQVTAPLDRNVDTIVRLVSPVDQVGWAQRNLRTPRSLPPAWIVPETVTFPERFVLTTTNEIPVGAYHLNVSIITGRDDSFTPLYQKEDANPLDRVLLGYVTSPWTGTIPTTATRLNAIFGNQVRLHSYMLEGEPYSGETMTATLYWEALQALDADYTVLVHLLDETGQFVASFDSPPLNGSYPTRGWLLGSPVPDPHLLALPPDLPPGEYQIRTGLYLPASGERLTAVDATGVALPNNTLLLQTITVAP
jgi:hypothetical protein